MFATAPRGETKKRTLHDDDIDGFCTIYPEGGQDGLSCDLSAVGFFERPEDGPGTECSSGRKGCACAAGSAGSDGVGWLALGGAGALWIGRRSRRRG